MTQEETQCQPPPAPEPPTDPPAPAEPGPGRRRISIETAYWLPMGTFLVFTFIGATWADWYATTYVVKTLAVAVLLAVLWRWYTRIRWTHLWLGAAVGVVGVVQWVGMEKLLMHFPGLWWTRMIADVRPAAYRPDEHFAQHPWLLGLFFVVRWLGPTLVVPLMEERFWRDWLWRSFVAPNDFSLAEIGEYEPRAIYLLPLLFASVHVQWLTAIVWALLIAWLLLRTRSLGACIVAHGVTNFLLGAYVLASWYGFGRNEWFFW